MKKNVYLLLFILCFMKTRKCINKYAIMQYNLAKYALKYVLIISEICIYRPKNFLIIYLLFFFEYLKHPMFSPKIT